MPALAILSPLVHVRRGLEGEIVVPDFTYWVDVSKTFLPLFRIRTFVTVELLPSTSKTYIPLTTMA